MIFLLLTRRSNTTIHREFITAPCSGRIRDIHYNYENSQVTIAIRLNIGTETQYAPIDGDLSITEYAKYMEYNILNEFGSFSIVIYGSSLVGGNTLIRRLGSHSHPGKVAKGNIIGMSKLCEEVKLIIPMHVELFIGQGEYLSGNSQVIAVIEKIIRT